MAADSSLRGGVCSLLTTWVAVRDHGDGPFQWTVVSDLMPSPVCRQVVQVGQMVTRGTFWYQVSMEVASNGVCLFTLVTLSSYKVLNEDTWVLLDTPEHSGQGPH